MADHNPPTSFSRFIALLVFSLAVMTGLAAGVSVSFDQPAITVMPGEVTTVNLTLDAAPAGISGFAIGISVEDPSIGEITKVTLPGWAELSDTAGVPGPEVSIMAVDIQGKVEKDASGILLATLSVKGLSSGTTEILLQEPLFADDDGNDLVPALSGVSLTVSANGSSPQSTTTITTNTTTSPPTTTVTTNITTSPPTTTVTTTVTTSGSIVSYGSGGGGSGGGSSSVSAPVVTTAIGTSGPETSPTMDQTSEQTEGITPAMTSTSVPSIPAGETTPPSPAGQGIPFLSAPGIMVLVCTLVLLGKKLR
jgi:hypothetical protein